MTDGVAEVERLANAGFALVAVDDLRLDGDAARDDRALGLGRPGGRAVGVVAAFELGVVSRQAANLIEVLFVGDGAVLALKLLSIYEVDPLPV